MMIEKLWKNIISLPVLLKFVKPDQLLAEVHEKGAHQLFFFDIEIRKWGDEGVEESGKTGIATPIWFVLWQLTEFMPLSLRYRVCLDYIDKALSAEEFESRIETALLYANSQDSSPAEDFYFKSKFAQFQYPL